VNVLLDSVDVVGTLSVLVVAKVEVARLEVSVDELVEELDEVEVLVVDEVVGGGTVVELEVVALELSVVVEVVAMLDELEVLVEVDELVMLDVLLVVTGLVVVLSLLVLDVAVELD
jgi:hypothetical protein